MSIESSPTSSTTSARPRRRPSRRRSRRRNPGRPLSKVGFRLAFLCTGNRFRSPLAALLLAEQTKELPVAVTSVGTLELGRVPALPEAVEIAETYGLDLSGHRATNFAEVDLEPYDLVIGFEQMHVAAAVIDGGARRERTFTLPELIQLLDAIPEPSRQREATERARARIEAAHAARPPNHPAKAVPEIADPLGKTRPAQRRTADEVRALVVELSDRLFG